MSPNFKKLFSVGAITLLFLVILGYSYFRASGVIYGVRITVDTIVDGQTVDTPLLQLSGTAKHAVKLTLNDRLITVDQDGVWNEALLLPDGFTIIKLHAEDKFGKSVEKTLQLVLKQ